VFKKKDSNKNEKNKKTSAEDKENCDKQLEELQERFLRVNADFQNYKNRIEQESLKWISGAQENVLIDFLSIVDDFDRAFAECEKHGIEKGDQIWLDGFKMISDSLYKLLEKYGVGEIEQSKEFNPEIHEAIAHIDSADHKSNELVDVTQKGFKRKDKVIRPSKVVVAK
jgi:molecular chaperone GrpE